MFAKFILGATGRATLNLNTVASSASIAGQAYMNDAQAAFADTSAVAASDGIVGGFRYTTAGALRVYDATAGLPANTSVNQGVAMTTDGQACYTTDVNTTYFNLAGVALDSISRVYANVLAFQLTFADAGAGVVTTTEAISAATPTFTRATAATTVLSTGLIGSVASGDPRSYYDPTSLTYLGYLAEGARTNLCLQSETFQNASWTKTTATAADDSKTGPDGATSASLITVTTASNTTLYQTFSVSASTTYTVSFFGKASTGTQAFNFGFSDFSANSFGGTGNFSTGVVALATNVGGAVGLSVSAKQYQNGWWRFTLSGTTDGAAISYSLTIGGDTTGMTFDVYGAQLEAASFASSYIPTTTLAVARNADVLTYPTSPWFNATAGTLFSQWRILGNAPASYPAVTSINDGTGNERYVQFHNSDNNQAQLTVVDGGVAQVADLGSTAVALDTTAKTAYAYAVNDFSISTNTGAVSSDTAGTLPTVTTLSIAGDPGSTGIFGTLRRVTYYGSRLANAELQAITT